MYWNVKDYLFLKPDFEFATLLITLEAHYEKKMFHDPFHLHLFILTQKSLLILDTWARNSISNLTCINLLNFSNNSSVPCRASLKETWNTISLVLTRIFCWFPIRFSAIVLKLDLKGRYVSDWFDQIQTFSRFKKKL